MNPSTPPYVLEDHRKETTESAMKVEEAEALCSKVVEQVSQAWEALIDDEELEQVTQQFHTTEAEFNKLQDDLKKLPMTEKMSKVVDMKKLQQQVEKLITHQQKRIDQVIELQEEVEKVTGIIQPVHEKVWQSLGPA